MDNRFTLINASTLRVGTFEDLTCVSYGVQWHPEVAHTEKGEELFMNFLEVCEEVGSRIRLSGGRSKIGTGRRHNGRDEQDDINQHSNPVHPVNPV